MSNRIASLDGVRGLAVLLVVGHHAYGSVVPQGGSLGVGLFFVLSGYLITRLLLIEHSRGGRIALGAFYARRFLRLYPALLIVLIMAPLLLWAANDERLAGYPLTLAVVGLYLTDFFQAMGFDFTYLSHTWSLAVEEQFYIVWPFALIGILWVAHHSQKLRALVPLVAAIAALSIAWRVFLLVSAGGDGADRVYFAPDSNSYLLLTGCLTGTLDWRRGERPYGRWVGVSGIISVIVLMVIAVAPLDLLGFDNNRALANLTSMSLLVMGPFAVLYAAHGNSRLLSFRPLVWIGTISYGLYLWHALLLRVEWVDGGLSGIWRIAAVLLAVVAAALSYRYVEKPILRFKRRWERAKLPVEGVNVQAPRYEHPAAPHQAPTPTSASETA
jgi:peptidoglycan/LPS O-acetylase OafA/YrhL